METRQQAALMTVKFCLICKKCIYEYSFFSQVTVAQLIAKSVLLLYSSLLQMVARSTQCGFADTMAAILVNAYRISRFLQI